MTTLENSKAVLVAVSDLTEFGVLYQPIPVDEAAPVTTLASFASDPSRHTIEHGNIFC